MKVCIAGGGKVGMYLAQSLLAHRHKVTIIEPQEALCRSLADALDVPVVCGDAISFDTLRTADVASCDAFVAVTGNDEDNLVACQIAKRQPERDPAAGELCFCGQVHQGHPHPRQRDPGQHHPRHRVHHPPRQHGAAALGPHPLPDPG